MSKAYETLLEYKREGLTEVSKLGNVCWFSDDKIIHLCGEDQLIYARSIAKPFHMKGLAQDLDKSLSWEEKALSVSSHNAEAIHLQTLKGLLAKGTGDLLLPPGKSPDDKEPNAHYHPCSGEHSAILCGCKLKNWKIDYTSIEHPFHLSFVSYIKSVLGSSWEAKHVAVDGCGLPTLSFRLSELAKLYANLVQEQKKDWIWDAMIRNPHLVGGSERLDTKIIKTCGGHVIAKEGADGLLGISIQHPEFPKGLGVVIKLSYGQDAQAMSFVANEVLSFLGWKGHFTSKLFRQTVFANKHIVPEK